MKKKTTNENVFGAVKKFTDAFFDGLKNNATTSILTKAENAGVPLPIVEKLKKLEKEKQELDMIIKKYSN